MIFYIFNTGNSFATNLAIMIAYIFALIVAFCCHEWAHAYSAYKFGDPTAKNFGRLTLNPQKHIDVAGFLFLIVFGFGWAKPVPIQPNNFKKPKLAMATTSLAGVFFNLILAFVFSGIYFFVLPHLAFSTNLALVMLLKFVEFGMLVNLCLMIFNLLPFAPLDGFNFLKSITKPNAIVDFLQKYGQILLLVFIISPAFDYIYQFVTLGVFKIFFSFWGLF